MNGRILYYKKIIVIIFIMIVTSLGISSAQNEGAKWQFENNGDDSASWDINDNNGILSGLSMYSSVIPLIEGNYYLSLEDFNNYGVFRVGDDTELDFENENIAISLWVYPVPGNDNPQFLLIKGNRFGNDKTNNYAIRLDNGYFEFIVHNASGAQSTARSTFFLAQNEWTFLAVYYNYTNSTVYLWNNPSNAPLDTIDFNAGLLPNNDSLYIGTAGKNGLKRFWGRIDDVRVGSTYEQIMGISTDVEVSNNKDISNPFFLYQNFPNPFNSTTKISFYLENREMVKLDVYNSLGEHISTLINQELGSGSHSFSFTEHNLPSGIYFYRIVYQSKSETKSMLLIK
jgi:Concanavalin A-like lectin/glucanases superfamily/Secretion system C-terminal sorting domain